MKLMVVKDGSHLHWPESLAGSEQRYRGASGYVVDMSAPLESEWCRGQEHKLRPAPAGSSPTKIDFTPALRALSTAKDAPKRPAAAESVKSKPLPAVDAFARK